MTVLEWDKVGDRTYQSGIDKGVLYLKDGRVVPWNGLVSVEDSTDAELKSYYLDGVKILEHVVPGDFAGKLTAITYPEEFDEVLGQRVINTGLIFHEQEFKSFNLAYRTKIGSDSDENYGYKIHLLYNIRAIPESHTFQTLSDEPGVEPFSWALTGTPPISTADGIRPTVHISIDSINARPDLLEAVENILYGTEMTDPRFPTLLEMRLLFGEIGSLYIVDNGNGTWTAIDPTDSFVTMLDSETFQIDHADVTYLDSDTYTITDTEFPLP